MFDRVWLNANLATMDGPGLGVIEDGAVAAEGGRIAWVGPRAALPGPAAETIDCAGAWILPGLIDCHTHLVFAGDRKVDKPGQALADDVALVVKGRDHPYVSRGGVKLAHGLDHWGWDVGEAVAGGGVQGHVSGGQKMSGSGTGAPKPVSRKSKSQPWSACRMWRLNIQP